MVQQVIMLLFDRGINTKIFCDIKHAAYISLLNKKLSYYYLLVMMYTALTKLTELTFDGNSFKF